MISVTQVHSFGKKIYKFGLDWCPEITRKVCYPTDIFSESLSSLIYEHSLIMNNSINVYTWKVSTYVKKLTLVFSVFT